MILNIGLILACNPPIPPIITKSKKTIPLKIPHTYTGTKDSLLFSCSYFDKNKPMALGLFISPDSFYYENYSGYRDHLIKTNGERFKDISKIIEIDSIHIRDSFFLGLVTLNPKKDHRASIFFTLLFPPKGLLYTLQYRYFGSYYALSPKYQMPDSLKSHRGIVQALEKFSAHFSLRFDPNQTKSEVKDSLLKRWVMLNDRAYDETSSPGKSFQLNTEEFQGDLTPGIRNFQNNDSLYKKQVAVSENGQYKIAAMVNGPVYAFNKASKKSFIVWVPDQPMHFIRSVQLKGNKVLLYDSILAPTSKLKPEFDYDFGQKLIRKLK